MTDNKTCPLCSATLLPRYEFVDRGGGFELMIRAICPDCIPPGAN